MEEIATILPMHQRSLTLDWLRTIAIVLMVIYHLLYDLRDVGFAVDLHHPVLWLIARTSLILFLGVSGATFALRASRGWKNSAEKTQWTLGRLLMIGSSALLVTVATYLMDPVTYVRFGVLHLLAVSTLVLALLASLHWRWHAIIGCALLASALVLPQSIETSWFLPLGFIPFGFSTLDYVPLLPWLGVVLLGFACFSLVPRWIWNERTLTNTEHILTWPGRNALLVYLGHQPLLVGVLYVMDWMMHF